MNKTDLKKIIKEIIRKKLNEQTLGSTNAPLQSDIPQDKKKSNTDDSSNMSDSDKIKYATLKKQQDKLTNDIRKIDGTIQKLKAPVLRKTQELERKKASLQPKVGRITTDIQSLQKKYS